MSAGHPRRSPGLVSTLLRRDFALLWVGGLLSYVGNWAMFTTLAYFVYERTGSALAASTLLALMVGPQLLSSLAGVLVDRWDRRRTLLGANAAMGLLTLPLLWSGSGRNLWLVYGSALAVAMAGLVVMPAENSLLPRLVGQDRLIAANSLNALNDNLGRIIGPAVGGALLAVGSFEVVVIFNAATYGLAAGLIFLIRRQDLHADATTAVIPRAGFWREWRAGLKFITASRSLMMIFVVATTALLGDAMLSGLLAPFVAGTLAAGAGTLALFLMIRGIGGIVGGLITHSLSQWFTPPRMIGMSLLLIGLGIACMTLVPTVPVALGIAGILGILVVTWLANQQSIIQTTAPNQALGRTFGALSTLSATVTIIGALLAGALGDAIGIRPLLFGAAGLYAIAGLVATVRGKKT